MIELANYGAFTLAAIILLIIPGPTIMTVVAYGFSQGARAAWASTAGVVAGDAVAVFASLTGLGALMAISANLFTVVKWAGAGYLIWLAIQTWRESNRISAAANDSLASMVDAQQATSLGKVFRQNFIVTALNPKGIVFFVAFIPQFVVPQLSYWPQVTIYGLTFILLGGLNALIYAYSAGRLAAFFTQARPLKWMKRGAAGFLGGAGIYTAFARFKDVA